MAFRPVQVHCEMGIDGTVEQIVGCVERMRREHATLVNRATHVILSSLWLKASPDHLPDALSALIAAWRETGARVAVTSLAPVFRPSPVATLARLFRSDALDAEKAGKALYDTLRPSVVVTNDIIARVAHEHDVTYLDKTGLLCPPGTARCTALTPGGAAVHPDASHLTIEGARHLGDVAARCDWLRQLDISASLDRATMPSR